MPLVYLALHVPLVELKIGLYGIIKYDTSPLHSAKANKCDNPFVKIDKKNIESSLPHCLL